MLVVVFNLIVVTAIPVVVDPWQNIVVAGGVVLQGLHAAVAPRRSQQSPPVLEQFTFVPYLDGRLDSSIAVSLEGYASDVTAYAIQGLKSLHNGKEYICNSNLLTVALDQLSSSRTLSQDSISEYLTSDGHGLMKV